MLIDLSKELKKTIDAAKKASSLIMEVYHTDFSVMTKEDDSPVTKADLLSDKAIREGLLEDGIGFLSEEEKDDLNRLKYEYLYIVDPLDGTADFVKKDDSFSVNIALVKAKRPIMSLIYLPYKNSYCYAIKDKGAYYVDSDGTKTKIKTSDKTTDLIALVSKEHLLDSELDWMNKRKEKISKIIPMGASEKGVFIARGLADLSLRYSTQTKEWDVAAMDLIVNESGGVFLDTRGDEFQYNREDVYNHYGYMMFNSKRTMEELL